MMLFKRREPSNTNSPILQFGNSVIAPNSVIRQFGNSVISSNSHKGSALLVVLGMLSFMLISAVAFSAYMRYSRLPSSFLRRSSASRLLAKAALAEAIDEIDAAIGNNPHPGIGTLQPREGAGSLNVGNGAYNEDLRTRNHWMHHVYIGTNQLFESDRTVSTLTLEGLAYIPAPLVNEARYYSRRSMAGMWKGLGFDSGRYAFCAIDVSDMLDVNRLSAKASRTSSPGGKISLAYLFESGEEHTGSDGDPKQWDDFLENQVKARKKSLAEKEVETALADDVTPDPVDSTRVPFVSVADLNLALDNFQPNSWLSPFCKYVLNNGGDFYGPAGVTDPIGQQADKLMRQNFVADSWLAPTEGMAVTGSRRLIDLSDFAEQPFETVDLTQLPFPVERLIDNPTREAGQRLANKLSFFGYAALYDYLDANNVPVSLAMPTTERAPMIAGIGNEQMNSAQLVATPTSDEEHIPNVQNPPYHVKKTTHVKINPDVFTKFIDEGTVKAVLAYPFRRGVEMLGGAESPFKFTLEGQLSVFFAREGAFNFRSGGGALSLNQNLFTGSGSVDQQGVIRIPLKFGNFSNTSFSNVKTEQDALKEADAILSQSNAKGDVVTYLQNTDLLTITEEWDVTLDANGNPQESEHQVTAADSEFKILTPGANAATALGSFLNGREEKLVVNSALWLRVKNGKNKTVDLVPASLADDDALNSANNANAMIIADIVGKNPLMLKTGGSALTVSVGAFTGAAAGGGGATPVPLDFSMNVQCIDPRWNWAPEHWYSTGQRVTKDTWKTAVDGFLGKEGRDKDIFLMTSDAGYMQSVYEIACLPRFTDLKNYGQNQVCGNMSRLGGTFNGFETSPDNVRNSGLMWKSYHPFVTDGVSVRDPFEALRLVNDGLGFRINPYTDNYNVMMAAFANTPCDWWAAARTTKQNLPQANGNMSYPEQSERLDAKNFNQDFCFNDFNTDARLRWRERPDQNNPGGLMGVARRFMNLVRQRVNALGTEATVDTWMDVWDGVEYTAQPAGLRRNANVQDQLTVNDQLEISERMDWDGVNSDFCGETSSEFADLKDVERRFLYGYWRECFAARQQLFLIFVRAEPMMMGGGASGQTPPQLGARAVALVWRDPAPSADNRTPHKTRVLFYRQFD